MNSNDLIILNFQEVRRRKVWQAIPEAKLNWRPDEKAFSCQMYGID